MRSAPRRGLVASISVCEDLGGDGRGHAERVEDVADDRGPEPQPKATIAAMTPSRITPGARRGERGDPNASMQDLGLPDTSARWGRESWWRRCLRDGPPS